MLATLCVAFGTALKQAGPPDQGPAIPAPTIEPALPVVVNMQLVSVTQTANGGTARLEVTVEPDTRIPELSIDVLLPAGLQVRDGTPIHGLSAALEAGERKRYEVPLVADRNGVFPIRTEMTFRLSDGRSFRTGQGTTLRLGAAAPEGRLNAGAYEFRGVPLEELHR